MKKFKFEAEGDTVYVKGDSLEDAKRRFAKVFGEIPESFLTITEIEKLPKGETLL